MAATFKFELVSPERLLLSEEVLQVDLPGSEGEFGVLANHAPFMTTLAPGVAEVTRADGSKLRIFIRSGFADVSPAGLTVLAERAIPVADLKADEIAQEIRNAEEDLADALSPEGKERAERKLAQLREVSRALAA
jgi:F-type H+-transporting ATPase subunit epsilon